MEPSRQTGERRHGAWTGGLILLVIGGLLLAEELGVTLPGTVWGLLLLVPAVGAAFGFYQAYQREETSAAVTQGCVALIFAALCIGIVMGLDLGLVWPLLLMALAISMLVRNTSRTM